MALLYPREMLARIMEESGVNYEPSARDTLFTLVDTVFFASMMVEEGEPVRVAIVHDEGGAAALAQVTDSSPETPEEEANPVLAWDVTQTSCQSFDPPCLAKLSRGLRYGTHLVVVGGRTPDLWIDGVARRTPRTDGGIVTRIAAPRPGVVVFEEQYRERLRFDAGRRVPPAVDVFTDACPIRSAVAAITGSRGWHEGYNSIEWALLQLVRKMRATGHGAILALLPQQPDETVLAKIPYRRTDPNLLANRIHAERAALAASIGSALPTDGDVSADYAMRAAETQAACDRAEDAIERALDDIAQLSAVDGAVLVGPALAVFGAGYLIPSDPDVRPVKALDAAMTTTEPVAQRHGARHQAAFSFADKFDGGVAFVVSEDGPVTCAFKVNEQVVVWPVQILET